MPRIPTRDNLRQGVPRSTGGIVSAPRDFTGPALQSTGRQLFKTASDQVAREQARQQQRSALELATARSQWNSGLLAEQATYTPQQNPDHGNWSKTYQTRATAQQKQTAKAISDPQVRRQFMAETQNDLVQVGIDIEQRAHDFGMSVRRAEADGALLQQVNTAALQPDENGRAAMGGIRASLHDMVQTGLISAEEAADRSIAYAQQYASFKTIELVKRDPVLAVSMLSGDEPGPAMLIRQLEGFRSAAYWQAGANRAGYGSNTVTREDGTIEEIAPGMAITRADADRDLARRVGETRNRVGDQVGRKIFEKLPHNVQAALISVGYISEILPDHVAEAVRTGDVEAIALAIETGEEDDDAGAQQRRLRQAQVVRADDGNAYEQIAQRPAWVGVLDPVLKSELHDAASQELERADKKRFLADRTFARHLGHAIRSDFRSVYSSGKFTDTESDDVLRELGEDKHRKWNEIRQDAAEIRMKTQDMPSLPDDEIHRLVETHRPQLGEDDFARRQAVHERVSRRAHEITQERKDHPARAALRVASVRRALSEAGDLSITSPEKVQALVREMRAAQSALGTPKALIAPVPDEWALEIGKALATIPANLGKSNKLKLAVAVQKMYAGIKDQYGEFADDVMSYSFGKARALSTDMVRNVGELMRSLGVAKPVNANRAAQMRNDITR